MGAKPKKVPVAAAVAAATRRGKKSSGGLGQYAASIAFLLFAVGATYVLTTSPRPAPKAPPKDALGTEPPRSVNEAARPESSECKSLVADGECANNADYMTKACPRSCAAVTKTTKAATKAEGPPDTDPNCGTWAASGECEKNAAFMLDKCSASCRSATEAVDLNQDCAAWVTDGECYRNPAFMLQQCKVSCEVFAASNAGILQDTSDTCVVFALQGGCERDVPKADTQCRASCHIQRICGNHTETVYCQKALRCEAIADNAPDCEARAAAGECFSKPTIMLKSCLKVRKVDELDVPVCMIYMV